MRPLDDLLGLVQVDAGRRERDLQRHPGGAHRAAGGVRGRQRSADPLARVGRLGVAVEADLHRADRQAREPFCHGLVEALAVGLDLEPDPGAAELLGEREEMRDDQRLAAAQHHVGHAQADDLVGDAHGLVGVELVGQALRPAPIRCSSAGSTGRNRA